MGSSWIRFWPRSSRNMPRPSERSCCGVRMLPAELPKSGSWLVLSAEAAAVKASDIIAGSRRTSTPGGARRRRFDRSSVIRVPATGSYGLLPDRPQCALAGPGGAIGLPLRPGAACRGACAPAGILLWRRGLGARSGRHGGGPAGPGPGLAGARDEAWDTDPGLHDGGGTARHSRRRLRRGRGPAGHARPADAGARRFRARADVRRRMAGPHLLVVLRADPAAPPRAVEARDVAPPALAFAQRASPPLLGDGVGLLRPCPA